MCKNKNGSICYCTALYGHVTSPLFTVAASLKTATLVLFGIAVYKDRMWMPRPDLNYMSWSYGLALMSTFFSIFSSIAHVVFNRITRREFYEPPSMSQPMVSHQGGMYPGSVSYGGSVSQSSFPPMREAAF